MKYLFSRYPNCKSRKGVYATSWRRRHQRKEMYFQRIARCSKVHLYKSDKSLILEARTPRFSREQSSSRNNLHWLEAIFLTKLSEVKKLRMKSKALNVKWASSTLIWSLPRKESESRRVLHVQQRKPAKSSREQMKRSLLTEMAYSEISSYSIARDRHCKRMSWNSRKMCRHSSYSSNKARTISYNLKTS